MVSNFVPSDVSLAFLLCFNRWGSSENSSAGIHCRATEPCGPARDTCDPAVPGEQIHFVT